MYFCGYNTHIAYCCVADETASGVTFHHVIWLFWFCGKNKYWRKIRGVESNTYVETTPRSPTDHPSNLEREVDKISGLCPRV